MSSQLQRIVRVLELLLVALTVAAGYAAITGRFSAAGLSAMVSVLIALSVAIDQVNRRLGRRGHCLPSSGK